jgi:Skp family chaperone for outer membrane proteins
MENRHKKILAAEAKLMQKQQIEMNALRKKLEGKMNERLKLREQEHNEILQRYENAKKQLENQQTLERNRLEKHYNTRPGTAKGRSMMAS